MKKFKQKLGKVLHSRLGRFASLAIMVVAVMGIFVAPVVPNNVEAASGNVCTVASQATDCETGETCNVDGSLGPGVGYCTPEMPIALVPVFLAVAGGIAIRVRRKAMQAA